MVSFERIGHGGASALAPANSLEAFDLALEHGVDTIEFDVRARAGRLVLAHTILHARRGGCLTLEAALRHLAGRRFSGVGLNADIKHAGCEAALIEALHRHGLLGRAVVSSQVSHVLDRARILEPRLRRAISIGGRAARASRRWEDWRGSVLAGLNGARWHAVMAQHGLIDVALRDAVDAHGGSLYGWTITTRAQLDRLRALEVAGAVSGDPRLLTAAAPVPTPQQYV